MARRADEMKMTGMPIGRLVSRSALAKVDLPGDAGFDEALQCAIDRSAADAWIVSADQLEKIVRAEVRLLPQEDVENAVALDGVLAARRTDGGGVRYPPTISR
jgi:hypothetical protein